MNRVEVCVEALSRMLSSARPRVVVTDGSDCYRVALFFDRWRYSTVLRIRGGSVDIEEMMLSLFASWRMATCISRALRVARWLIAALFLSLGILTVVSFIEPLPLPQPVKMVVGGSVLALMLLVAALLEHLAALAVARRALETHRVLMATSPRYRRAVENIARTLLTIVESRRGGPSARAR